MHGAGSGFQEMVNSEVHGLWGQTALLPVQFLTFNT